MRKDMAKVIVERPRRGASTQAKRKARQHARIELMGDPDSADIAKTESMKEHHVRKYNGKELNEHLAPLRRWIDKQVGRPWDKVYSEARERIDPRSAVQIHILSHLDGYVEKYVELVGKKVMDLKGHEIRSGGLYVHPVTKLLCIVSGGRRKWWLTEPTAPDPDFRALTTTSCLRRNDRGIWFELSLRLLPKTKRKDPITGTLVFDAVHDVWTKGSAALTHPRYPKGFKDGPYSHCGEKLYGNDKAYCFKKRQISSAEIRSYGLKET